MTERLTRSTNDRLIAGVAGGIAAAVHVDSLIIRLIWVVFFIFHPMATAVLYLLLAVLLPEGETEAVSKGGAAEARIRQAAEEAAERVREHVHGLDRAHMRSRGERLFGLLLLVVGIVLLLPILLPGIILTVLLWPVILVLLGIWLLADRRK